MTEVQLQAVLIYCKTRLACRRDLSPPAAPPPAVTRWTRLIYRRHLHVR